MFIRQVEWISGALLVTIDNAGFFCEADTVILFCYSQLPLKKKNEKSMKWH